MLVLRVLLVSVSFLIFLIVHVLEGKPTELQLLSVHYDTVIGRLRSQTIFLSPHNLELVIVQHADVGDCRRCPILILSLVLLDEG